MTLGKHCSVLTMAVLGQTTVEAARKVVNTIIKAIGMTAIFEPTVYQYEENIGIIYIQPIFESFVAYDAWPCHGGGYINVLSCRDFSPSTVMSKVAEAGYEIVDHEFSQLALAK